MKLTIEIDSLHEAEQVLRIFNSIHFEIVRFVVEKQGERTVSSEDLLKKVNRPIAKKLNLKALKKAKNYQGVNRERFDKLVKEIDIKEPIELLLSQLTK